MEELVSLLIDKGISIGSCESLTGGLFASKLSAVAGVSVVFKGSLVTYSNECKQKLAHVSATTLEKYGAISKETVLEMAKNTAIVLDVDMCVAFSGNAGPGVMEDKASGLVYTAIYFRNQLFVDEFQMQGSRNAIREQICDEMVKKCVAILGDL